MSGTTTSNRQTDTPSETPGQNIPRLETIAASSVSIDRHSKKNVWRVDDRAVDWFVLRQARFELLAPEATGVIKSEVFPGLWLDVAAMLAGNMQRVLSVVQQGVASAGHADFVAQLQRKEPRA